MVWSPCSMSFYVHTKETSCSLEKRSKKYPHSIFTHTNWSSWHPHPRRIHTCSAGGCFYLSPRLWNPRRERSWSLEKTLSRHRNRATWPQTTGPKRNWHVFRPGLIFLVPAVLTWGRWGFGCSQLLEKKMLERVPKSIKITYTTW